jgi:hypothetical protein
MLSDYHRHIPKSLGLSKAEAASVVEVAKVKFGERGYAWLWMIFVWIVTSSILSGALQWFSNANGWPDWIANAVLWSLIVVGLLLVFWVNPRIGLRRAIFDELIERGYDLCPRCGYELGTTERKFLCPECGACPERESWDLATLNIIERIRFRYLDTEPPLPFQTRRAIVRNAWKRVRDTRSGFVVYVLCWTLAITVAVSFSIDQVIGAALAVPLLAAYLHLEVNYLKPAIRREITERSGPSGTSPH